MTELFPVIKRVLLLLASSSDLFARTAPHRSLNMASKSMSEVTEQIDSPESLDTDVKPSKYGNIGVQEVSSDENVSIDMPSTSIDKLREIVRKHKYDLNFPPDIIARANLLLNGEVNDLGPEYGQSLLAELQAYQELEVNDSPYDEVRSTVPPTDDPTLPVNTFRVWFLGSLFSIFGAGINELFGYRYPSIYLSPFVGQLLCWPCGVAMARYLPKHRFRLGRWSMTLNPGPFNQKEHGLITAMANISFYGVYVTSLIMVLKLDIFFGEKVMSNSPAFRILLALSTQLLGFGCAGVTRPLLVYQPAMIWPRSLAQIALNRALHNDDGESKVPGWSMSRKRFFQLCFVGMFFYYWFPGYLFQAMSYFNWLTWISPNNVTLALVTGSFCGLGLNPWPTFDWNVISLLGDPIVTPFFGTVNTAVGTGIAAFLIIPLLYWYNAFNTAYLPLNSTSVFDKFAMLYNVSTVLNPDYTLNLPAYEAYSRPYIGAGFLLAYMAEIAAFTALITYVMLHYWTELRTGTTALIKRRSLRQGYNDIHSRLMKVYPEVPQWWFGIILVVSFVLGCVVCSHWNTGLPIWSLVLAVALCFVLQMVIGIMTAVTNVELYTNVISQFIAGFALPGRPIAVMIFKSFGTEACSQSISFSQDLKMGHYLRIPPRLMFLAQVYVCVLTTFVSVGVNSWLLVNIKDLCHPHQSARYTCPGEHIFFSSAIIWGAIGPNRIFGHQGQYNAFLWSLLVGAMLPIPFWLVTRKYPTSVVRYIQIPVIIYGAANLAPFNFSWVWPTCIFGFIFNFYIKRRYQAWWLKYAYVLTTSFNVAIALSAIVIFFAVQFHDRSISWWGNSVSYGGVDGGSESAPMCVLKVLADGANMPGT